MPSVRIARGRHDVQFAEHFRIDLALRQWSVDVGSFILGAHETDVALATQAVLAIVPTTEADLADCFSWIAGVVTAGRKPILISPEALDLPESVLSGVGGVTFRGSLTYDQIFQEIFRELVGVLPPWLDILVRPSLVRSPTGVAWWADDLFVADDKYGHVVRISPGDSTVVVPGLSEPRDVTIGHDQLVIANKAADEILSCDIVDNMASNVEAIHELAGAPLRRPHAAVLNSRASVVADSDNDRVVYSIGHSHNWTVLEPDSPFSRPCGVCIDESSIWVADTFNHRVVRFDFSGRELFSTGSDGGGQAGLGYPVSLQRWKNMLFVADELNEHLKVFEVVVAGGSSNLVPVYDHFASEWIGQPVGMSINRNNRMAVADRKHKCIWLVDLSHITQEDPVGER